MMDIAQDEITDFFRAFALDDSALDHQQRAARDRFAESYPAEWAAAQRLGPISREEQAARESWNRSMALVNATVTVTRN